MYDLARIFGLPTNIAKKAEVRCGMDMITSDIVICTVVIYIKKKKSQIPIYLSIYLSNMLYLTPVWPITTAQSEIIAVGIEGGILCTHVILQSIDDLGCEIAEV